MEEEERKVETFYFFLHLSCFPFSLEHKYKYLNLPQSYVMPPASIYRPYFDSDDDGSIITAGRISARCRRQPLVVLSVLQRSRYVW